MLVLLLCLLSAATTGIDPYPTVYLLDQRSPMSVQSFCQFAASDFDSFGVVAV